MGEGRSKRSVFLKYLNFEQRSDISKCFFLKGSQTIRDFELSSSFVAHSGKQIGGGHNYGDSDIECKGQTSNRIINHQSLPLSSQCLITQRHLHNLSSCHKLFARHAKQLGTIKYGIIPKAHYRKTSFCFLNQ